MQSRAVTVGARRRPWVMTPAQAVVIGFLGAIAVATALLSLPIAHAPGVEVTLLQAAFTAVSAVCVTGHIVVDTATVWSPFGHAVIVAFIQIGGLGIMLVASLIGLALLRRVSLRGRMVAGAENRGVTTGDAARLARGILLVSLVIEAIVAVILTLQFWLGYGVALPTALGRTNLVLAMTGLLLVLGTVIIALFEWSNPATIGEMSPVDRVLVSFFHSVQTRTAGFNSVDIGQMTSESWLVMDVLMFIGGGPAGTAGGIKVTTFAVLLFIIITELRGEGAVNIFGKRLSRAVHREAITITLLSMAAVMGATIALMVMTRLDLDVLLFEVVSAFGTVGLSTGITASLPPAGQLILMLLMFLGRLGPLTLGTALVLRQRRVLYELPKERPVIG